ncbi:hypothetical protein BKA83DRAFT_4188596 [Pisolithus microcarpus]|nr:hypothetical protein BKA83DRAFT_4188596 [Pisolithus microcarpus]
MSMVSPVVTGYYRYTDIFFEWHQALPNPEDRSPLKALLAQDAFVHPDHPLHKEGVEGAELYLGTLQNFESRLLLSSAQVEYMRYWLHAMQLTKHPIPLPYSDCLLTESNLRHVSPVHFKTREALRTTLKQIEKNNKRLKGVDPTLSARRDIFERVRSLWTQQQGHLAWDRDHTLLTEFGWSTVRWDQGSRIEEQGHLIVKERRYYTNTFVSNNRDHFSFGKSEEVNKATFKRRIQALIEDAKKSGPLFLVFHDNNQDIKYLKSKDVDVQLPDVVFLLPDVLSKDGIFVLDTSDLFAALGGSLERVCRHLQIPTSHLHNAGNDAHYTMLALISMASGEPIDMQRAPNAPLNRAGVRVHFDPWEEDDDFSDQEGVCGPAVDISRFRADSDDETP